MERHRASSGHWKSVENQRAFFDQIALSHNIQKPEDWYSLPLNKIAKSNGGKFVSNHYGGSVIKGNVLTL
jgi:hypothetical protein